MLNKFIQKLYWSLGINLQKPKIVFYALPRIWTRPFDHLPLKGVGAEIGVYSGFHAKELLNRHPSIKELWLVDPYTPYPLSVGGSLSNLEDAKKAAHKLLKNHKNIIWLEEPSPNCIHKLPLLDFAYIDASHGYETVKKDIEAIYPKIKKGGILGGHDFHLNWPELITAVCEFIVQQKIQLYVESPDWWIIKP